jgi:hypothetical protein
MHNGVASQWNFHFQMFHNLEVQWVFAKSHVTELERNGMEFSCIVFDVSSLQLVVSIVKCNSILMWHTWIIIAPCANAYAVSKQSEH